MSCPRAVVPLGGLLSACLLATVHAQTPACDTLAVANDPVTSDSLYPPTLADVRIPSSGARMNGVLYLAQGKGPHTTVLVLHGFPGTEKNTDLAQVVRRAGFNALIFHYRGAWGSEGDYSFSHVLEDVAAALRWLRQPAVADSYRVNTRRLILVGHSLGGFAALHGAVADNGVRAVAALAPADFGRRGERLKDPEAFAASVRRFDPQLGRCVGRRGKLSPRTWSTTPPSGSWTVTRTFWPGSEYCWSRRPAMPSCRWERCMSHWQRHCDKRELST